MDAYQAMLLAYLAVLLTALTVFTVLRLVYPAIPVMTADEAHREFVARRCRGL